MQDASQTRDWAKTQHVIEQAFDATNESSWDRPKVQEAVDETFSGLERADIRVAEKKNGEWVANPWIKKAVLLSFRLSPMRRISGVPGQESADIGGWWDKVDSRFAGMSDHAFTEAGFRAVPGAVVRRSAYIAPGAVLMPCFVNLGAYVGEQTMIDTWATVGSCAQIGARVHISGGAGIGGVLEPLQAAPVIIEDDCFIGARSEVAEGVVVEQGSVLSMGVFIGASTKIVDRETGDITYGRVPAYSVVVPGSLPGKNGVSLSCAVIVKRVDARTRSKTGINELLRDG